MIAVVAWDGKPSRHEPAAPGQALLAAAVGSLEQPDVSFLSASPLANEPYVPCAAAGSETSAGAGGRG